MLRESKTSILQHSRPSTWPEPPQWMSVSTLYEMEACPRRWALNSADYKYLWKHKGYPRMPQLSTLEGTVVHLTLQRITSALAQRGCPSLRDESAISILKNLGGYSAIILDSVDNVLRAYEGNPRATPFIDGVRQRLEAIVPELRLQVQILLSHIHIESCAVRLGNPITQPDIGTRYQLQYGSHAEVELRASELRWHGVADFLTLSTTRCEIRDFKTGIPKPEHEWQIRIYALLWARDGDLNPYCRLADKLILSYVKGNVEVPPLLENELSYLEDELKARTIAAVADLQINSPKARLSSENCVYCSVRHLCDEYWQWNSIKDGDRESNKSMFVDLQIKLIGQHGPSSWDAVVESPSDLKSDTPFILRYANLRFDLLPAQRLRVLNAHISIFDNRLIADECPAIVATIGTSTEVFLLPE